MVTWQADFYRRPLRDASGKTIWELAICSVEQNFKTHAFCAQSEADSGWLAERIQAIANATSGLPHEIQVFRPQTLSLIETAGQRLGIAVRPTRKTPELKAYLKERASHYRQLDYYVDEPYDPIKLEQPPPLPIPDVLLGERWRFAAIAAGDLEPFWRDRPIPILDMPESLLPLSLKLPSALPVPGVVIDGGRQTMRLAQWVQGVNPSALKYMPGDPDGLILDAGLVDRWVMATFEDPDVQASARTFQSRLQHSQGLHFLLIQPDDSGMTYSGFWLLQTDEPREG